MNRPARIFWLLVLAFHAVAGLGALWLLPGGFPFDHPRFWSNRVAPVLILGDVILAFFAARRHRFDLLGLVLLSFPFVWAAGALSLWFLFPITFRYVSAAPLIGAGIMAIVWVLTFRTQTMSAISTGRIWAVSVASIAFGAALPLTQRAPEPDTQPTSLVMPERSIERNTQIMTGGKLDPHLWISPGDGSVTVSAGKLRVVVKSLLTFISRSPDGCATILAPPELREGPNLFLRATDQENHRLTLWYQADYEAMLSVTPAVGEEPIVVESFTELEEPIYSHLNSFCDLEVSGHKQLGLSFSPCPETIVDVLPTDYPSGRPLRLAYLDAHDRFRVVEATSGEKGPFRTLASGTLSRQSPLGITLHDQGKPMATFVLEDWSAQSGTQLSPTAGWGVPVNAIEFSLGGDAPTSPAGIYITLAGTSVGRGWDSVGHTEGTYRNRITVHPHEPPNTP